MLDLETTVYRTILHDSLDLEIVTFTTAGDGLWIYDIDPGSEPGALRTFRVSTIDFATRTARIVFEQSVDENTGSNYYNWWINSRGGVAEMPNGEIVTATPTGVWIGDPEGQEFRRLDVPDAACSVVRPWNATEVLMECKLPCAEECGEVWSGLWLIPTDGRASAPLAIPERFNVAYYDAAPLDGGLAISAVFGPGECNHHVVLVEAESIDVWTPPIAAVDCMEYVVGVRNGAVLIDAGNPYASSDRTSAGRGVFGGWREPVMWGFVSLRAVSGALCRGNTWLT